MSESVLMMARFGGYALLIILVVFVIAVLTPKLATFIDKIAAKGKNPARVEDNNFPDVKGIYDGDSPSDKEEEKNENGDVN
ncbi:MAG: hypothetical protein IKK32_07655 [Oscillospiraceae bacterium]|nr:hypothetical protein [Oscillospiraceae bacterium]MBR4092738.1 hypothetical protein [Oscillospiraceae bacterium]MBR4093731.1 hypothetical protein [Oscillospiraceae bacterium]